MAVKTKAELLAYSAANILTGGSQTRAVSLRQLVIDTLDSLLIPGEVQPWTLRPNANFSFTVGAQTAGYATLYLLPHATATSVTNYVISSEGTHGYFNAPGAAGELHFRIANVNQFFVKDTDGMPVTLASWSAFSGTHAALWFANTPADNNIAIAGSDTQTILNAFTDVLATIKNDTIFKLIATRMNILKNVVLSDDDTDPAPERLNVYGNMQMMEPGNRLQMASGPNAFVGEATLVSGTVSVANTAVRNGTSRIMLSRRTGLPRVLTYTITDGVGFDINSADAADNGVVSYFIVDEV